MKAIPLVYNLESVRARWASALVAVIGIAGTVAVFIAMLALANGFRATLISSGSVDNAIARRAGATSEMDSSVSLDSVRALEHSPGVASRNGVPLVSPEVVVVVALPLKESGTEANVQVRGVTDRAPLVHDGVSISRGRFLNSGAAEIVAGKNALSTYSGLEVGQKVSFGGVDWTLVGELDSGGSAFDSELWADATLLNSAYKRPIGIFQSVTIKLEGPGQLPVLQDAIEKDPRLTLAAEGEREYYERSSQMITTLITVLGSLIAFAMGVGATFGALNTMYSAVAERSREIATLRALGFGEGAVLTSFVIEGLVISAIGGLLGCIVVLPLNGLTTGTMNWQTFSHLAFAFRATPPLMAAGLGFALFMGLVGGVPPAWRAARLPVAEALRGL
jgi:putative ABC transport system permease protein